MKKKLFLFFCFLLPSCKENAIISDEKDNTNQFNLLTYFINDSIKTNGLHGLVDIAVSDYYSTEMQKSLNDKSISAYFLTPNYSHSIDAGNLLINGDTVIKSVYPNNNIVNYHNRHYTDFNNTDYNILITGSNAFPACNLNLQSPLGYIDLSSPIQGQIVSRQQDLNITWTGNLNSSSYIYILISSTAGNNSIERVEQDDGSIVISSQDLKELPIGEYYLSIHWGTYNYVEIPGRPGKYVVAIARYNKSITFNIN